MLHERDDVAGAERSEFEHTLSETMSEETSREPQNVFDRPWAEAALPQKVELKAAHKLFAFGLSGSEWWACRDADFDQMFDEQSGQVGHLDLGFG